MEQIALARYITKLLIFLGFSPRHFGFSYIRDMIMISLESSEKKLANIYTAVALKHDQPVDAVQTAVRTALKTAQNQSSFCLIESLIGAKFIEPSYQLAPREFIGMMLEYLTYVWDGRETILKGV